MFYLSSSELCLVVTGLHVRSDQDFPSITVHLVFLSSVQERANEKSFPIRVFWEIRWYAVGMEFLIPSPYAISLRQGVGKQTECSHKMS